MFQSGTVVAESPDPAALFAVFRPIACVHARTLRAACLDHESTKERKDELSNDTMTNERMTNGCAFSRFRVFALSLFRDFHAHGPGCGIRHLGRQADRDPVPAGSPACGSAARKPIRRKTARAEGNLLQHCSKVYTIVHAAGRQALGPGGRCAAARRPAARRSEPVREAWGLGTSGRWEQVGPGNKSRWSSIAEEETR